MSVSRKLRAGLALGAVLASCQLVVGCGDTDDDVGSGGTSSTAGKAGSAQGGKAGAAGHAGSGHAGSGHAGEAEMGMAGEAEMGGGSEAGGGTGGISAGGTGGAHAGMGGSNAGSGGRAGSGGSSAGSGGSSAGTGGRAGSGGSSAGTGGSSAGTGGSSAGTGGSSAGTGGSSAGTGGSHAGTGGSSAGTGGSSAGTGGTGGSAPVCGNSVVETGELCDPQLTVNNCGRDCKAITSTACLACETSSAQYGYDQTFLTCNTAVGNTTTATVTGSTGAAKPTDPNPVTTPVGTSKAMLCNEVVDCVRDTHCAAGGFPTLSACYCGTASQGDCNNGLGNGKCKAEIERALEATSFSTVAQRAGQTLYGGGVAMSRIDADQSYCDDDCLPL